MVLMLENPSCSIDCSSAVRVLSESTSRTATVVRCAADKAISVANGALELGCSLAMLDSERRKEKAKEMREAKEAETKEFPHVQVREERRDGKEVEEAEAAWSPPRHMGHRKEESEQEEEEEVEASKAADGKPKQAKLVVRNLRWLESLNTEVLDLQKKLSLNRKKHYACRFEMV